ncbi:MAG: PP2C family protein-serine/threonine phosphatase, partial [Lachnospiraceae bacterium]|nr:PP2C family protein-serine/threonine phosphatase [Lachnospiraceae bacterium]
AMYDEETSSMVYVVDPDEENRLYPGEWEPVSRKGMMKFLNWNGENMLYDIGKPAKYGWMCTAGTPIRNQDGELCCFLLVDVTIDNVLIDMRAYALQITIALIVAIAVISRLSLVYMRKNLLAPINMISKVAEDYSRSRNAGDKEIHLFSNLNIRTGDEVENLSLIMADMERNISEYEKNLTKITAEKERYNTELALSTRIQAAMLPDKFPAFTDQNSFDIFALMKPAREVGGDFYDFYMVDDTHLCIVIADVSGKGIPAALFMMVSKIIIANNAKAGKSPATILQDTNTSLCSNNKEEMFVTVWLGILDITTGTVTAANAGHEYPIIKSPGGNYEIIKDKHGVALGIMAGVKYKEYTVELAPGSKLFVYTDGVPEAGNSDKQMFSLQRMIDILNEHKDLPPKETLNAVEQGVYAYTQDAIQFDDITMLCLEYKGNYHSFNQDKE